MEIFLPFFYVFTFLPLCHGVQLNDKPEYPMLDEESGIDTDTTNVYSFDGK